MTAVKDAMRKWLVKVPVRITTNQWYDHCTLKIINERLSPSANTVDVGCHKGEVMDQILQKSPTGKHFGFEPIPALYSELTAKYKANPTVTILPYALSNEVGETTFNFVKTNPAYSGLIKRSYDSPHEQEETIHVQTQKLDNVVPHDVKIDFIKIDVEGGEWGVLQGSIQLIAKNKPLILFEHGLGASDHYQTTPDMLFSFFDENGYGIYLLEGYLNNKTPLKLEDFKRQFYDRINYYFVANHIL